jgi:hypothetical protein
VASLTALAAVVVIAACTLVEVAAFQALAYRPNPDPARATLLNDLQDFAFQVTTFPALLFLAASSFAIRATHALPRILGRAGAVAAALQVVAWVSFFAPTGPLAAGGAPQHRRLRRPADLDGGLLHHDGGAVGTDPKGQFAALVEIACAAARALDDLDRVVHLSFGDFTARQYFWQINMFRGLRAHEIAKVSGADVKLPDDLVQGIWDEVSPNAEEWRKIGVFAAAVPVPPGAPLLDRLLGLTGRDPKG